MPRPGSIVKAVVTALLVCQVYYFLVYTEDSVLWHQYRIENLLDVFAARFLPVQTAAASAVSHPTTKRVTPNELMDMGYITRLRAATKGVEVPEKVDDEYIAEFQVLAHAFDAGIAEEMRAIVEEYPQAMLGRLKHDNCKLFFQYLHLQDPEWKFNKLDDGDVWKYDKEVFEESFMRKREEELKKKRYKLENPDISDEDLKNLPEREWADMYLSEGEQQLITQDYLKKVDEIQRFEQAQVNMVTQHRTFGSCFLDANPFDLLQEAAVDVAASEQLNAQSASKKKGWFGNKPVVSEYIKPALLNNTCANLETRLFPWLTGKFPVYTRWNGVVVLDRYPVMLDYISGDEQRTKLHEKATRAKQDPNAPCFMQQFLQGLNGRGIVISASSHHKDDLIGLIRVLRGLDNTLPVHIFHRGEMEKETQDEIVAAGRHAFRLDKMPDLFTRLQEMLNFHKDQYQKNKNTPASGEGELRKKAAVGRGQYTYSFPPQEIWFVNVKGAVLEKYQGAFSLFLNKLLPVLFGLFDDTLLMDTDTVPFIKPSDFFKLNIYEQTGTLYFLDREIMWGNQPHDRTYFAKMMPTMVDQLMFGIPQVTNHTLNNRFFTGKSRYQMELGVVGYRKLQHFNGLFMAATINMWQPTHPRLWGDKELFWLGLLIVGDEFYDYNGNAAGAVGRITPQEFRPEGTVTKEICSIQPVHILSDDDQTLLWMNSGFKLCKKPGLYEKSKHLDKLRMYSGAQDLKDETINEKMLKVAYQAPITIQAAIIPPDDLKRKLPVNGKDEPQSGWSMLPGTCDGYLWCAYDRAGGSDDPEYMGKLVHFSVVDEMRYSFLGDLWTGYTIEQEGVGRTINPLIAFGN